MSKDSVAVSDAPVDLEKGTADMKQVKKHEEAAIVDPLKAKLFSGLMDAYFMFFVLLVIGIAAYMVKVSNNWWDMCLCQLLLFLVAIPTFWVIPKLKKLLIKLYATKRSTTSGSDLSAKLLPSEK